MDQERTRLTTGCRISTHRRRVLSVFQAPSALYRLLGIRHRRSPCFLHRNLKYLRGRISKRDLATCRSRCDVSGKSKFNSFSCDVARFRNICPNYFEILHFSGKASIISWTLDLIEDSGAAQKILMRNSILPSQNRFFIMPNLSMEVEMSGNIIFQIRARLKTGISIESHQIPVNIFQGSVVAIQLYSSSCEAIVPTVVVNCRLHFRKVHFRSTACDKFSFENFTKPFELPCNHLTAKSISITTGHDNVPKSYSLDFRNESLVWQPLKHSVLQCPWCGLTSVNLSGLLMHFQNVHPRFAVTLQNNCDNKIALSVAEERADRSIASDSSFEDILADLSRKQFTYCGMQLKIGLRKYEDFFEDHMVHKFISSNRLPSRRQYYTKYGARVMADDSGDMKIDESSTCMQWRHRESVDDFIDISPQEKELIKLWNSYLIDNPIYADVHVIQLCTAFVLDYADSLIGLRNNLLLHFTTMFTYGALSTVNIEYLIHLVNKQLGTCRHK